MVTHTTMANNGIWFRDVWSAFLCLGVILDRVEYREHGLPAMWGNVWSVPVMELLEDTT